MVDEHIGWMVKSINTPGDNDFKTEKQRMHRRGIVLNGFRFSHGTQTTIFVEPEDGVGRENGFQWVEGEKLAELIRDLAQPDGRRGSQRVRTIGEFQNRYIISDSFLDFSI